MNSAKVIRVIVTESNRGSGVTHNPHRVVTEYWTPDGKHLAVVGHFIEEEARSLRAASASLCAATERPQTDEGREVEIRRTRLDVERHILSLQGFQ